MRVNLRVKNEFTNSKGKNYSASPCGVQVQATKDRLVLIADYTDGEYQQVHQRELTVTLNRRDVQGIVFAAIRSGLYKLPGFESLQVPIARDQWNSGRA